MEITCQRCPFYGFRWPERRTELIRIGGNECGLDFDNNRPCKMETSGRAVDFSRCEVVAGKRVFLSLISDRLRFFPSGPENSFDYGTWTSQIMQRRFAMGGHNPPQR